MSATSRHAGPEGRVEVLPDPGTVADPLGCLAVLAAPSCFGFLLFVCLLIGGVAWHDLAI